MTTGSGEPDTLVELPIEGAPGAPAKPTFLRALEDGAANVALAAMAILPIVELLWRTVSRGGIPGAGPLVQHLTLWVGFLGAAIAAREGRLLALATVTFIPAGRPRRIAEAFAAAVSAAVAALLCRAGIGLVLVERTSGESVAFVPVWVAQLVLPIAFALIALRLVWRAPGGIGGRALAGLGLVAGIVIGQAPQWLEGRPAWPGLTLVLVGTALGGPIFALLGGIAVVYFLQSGVPIAAMPVETYRLAVNPTLAAVPLFTLTGYLLSESQA